MSTTSNYKFNNVDRIEDDSTTLTQRTLQNDRYSNYATMNYFSNIANDEPIRFATSQPAIIPVGVMGSGVGGNNVDGESLLLLKTDQERALGRLNLMERQFLTVPYLGRGSVDPALELRLLEGEPMGEKKSVSTVTAQSFMGYTLHPSSKEMEEKSGVRIEESAMKGWVRGGSATRAPVDTELAKKGRPSNGGF
jgi:hypothetical protein